MSDKKRIDLQKHVSPKVPKSYLIRIAVYVGLIAGLILVIYFMRDNETDPKPEKSIESVEEIRDYTIDTLQ